MLANHNNNVEAFNLPTPSYCKQWVCYESSRKSWFWKETNTKQTPTCEITQLHI